MAASFLALGHWSRSWGNFDTISWESMVADATDEPYSQDFRTYPYMGLAMYEIKNNPSSLMPTNT